MRRYRRVLLTLIMLLIASIPLTLYLLASTAHNAPLEIGSGTVSAPDGEIAVQTADGTIPTAPPPREMLVTTNQDGTWDVLLLRPDGSASNFTADDSGAVDILGTWSMDGQWINFLSNRRDAAELGPTQVTAAGENLRTLTGLEAVFTLFRERQFDWDPAWSPDGSRILWASVRDLNLELYTISTDTEFAIGSATRLTHRSARDWFHAWSPDGSRIAFSSDAAGNEDVYVIDVASGEITQLTQDENDDTHPIWTRDGSEILFFSEREAKFVSGELRIYIMDADGRRQRPLPADQVYEAGLMWLPQDDYMSFISNQTGRWHVYVSRMDGSGLRRVTDGPGDYLVPEWRP